MLRIAVQSAELRSRLTVVDYKARRALLTTFCRPYYKKEM